jgi:hypothetical protein
MRSRRPSDRSSNGGWTRAGPVADELVADVVRRPGEQPRVDRLRKTDAQLRDSAGREDRRPSPSGCRASCRRVGPSPTRAAAQRRPRSSHVTCDSISSGLRLLRPLPRGSEAQRNAGGRARARVSSRPRTAGSHAPSARPADVCGISSPSRSSSRVAAPSTSTPRDRLADERLGLPAVRSRRTPTRGGEALAAAR